MNKKVTRILLVIACIFVILAIGFVIGINVKEMDKPKPKAPTNEKGWEIIPDELATKIEENFWSFVKQSYIIVGTPPDCQLYKIVDEVPRHTYSLENFYAEADGLQYYHDAEGNRISSVAIDVSGYQTNIDWETVRAAGVEVAMLRVGYRGYGTGKIVEDEAFQSHLEGATSQGMRVGVYFYSQAVNYEEGVEEAKFVLDTIKDAQITCPIAIDTEFLEVEEARAYDLDNAARTDAVVGFCETIKAAGYTPMIYSNRNWFAANLDMTRLGDYSLWLAHYSAQPDFPYQFQGWQYTGNGSLAGVEGEVDLNVWFDPK